MNIVRKIGEFPRNPTIITGFVPTMGALHEGHLSLIRMSAKENDRTVVSIFVNPTQFGPNEDFSRYPRPFEEDCRLAFECGADLIFAPDAEDIYSTNPTTVSVPYVTDQFEGQRRPGHFQGVATIVTKLFNIVAPTNSYFGEKDLQQCALVKKLVDDLNLPTNIRICETVREPDGLAMSSRNRYLSSKDRELAPMIYQVLARSKDLLLNGEDIESTLDLQAKALSERGFRVDYLALVDRLTMHPTQSIIDNASLIIAAYLSNTRLIDNIRVVG